jgi:hypothetical protein
MMSALYMMLRDYMQSILEFILPCIGLSYDGFPVYGAYGHKIC